MATPADERLLEVLGKWLKSLELHIRYSTLDNDSYASVQPWPEHQRPSRWIIDLALQKTLALKAQVQERIKKGDTQFSDSLELMTFLTNLVGSEHIERFIPLADPANEHPLPRAGSAAAPSPAAALSPAAAPTPAAAPIPAAAPRPTTTDPDEFPLSTTATREMPVSVTATREMPPFIAAKRPPHAPPPVATQQVARTERRSAHLKSPAKSAHKHPAKPGASGKHEAVVPPIPRAAHPAPAKHLAHPANPAHAKHAAHARPPPASVPSAQIEAVRDQVIADAVRLVQWGRKWYELAELIARMADRPPLPDVRRILKDNKTAIEKKAGRG